jgi:selenoprotein W-related protein
MDTYKQKMAKLVLVPSGGGKFEVTIDGELVYSKLETGEFPDHGVIHDAMRARLG